jgi:hypothetical protein
MQLLVSMGFSGTGELHNLNHAIHLGSSPLCNQKGLGVGWRLIPLHHRVGSGFLPWDVSRKIQKCVLKTALK